MSIDRSRCSLSSSLSLSLSLGAHRSFLSLSCLRLPLFFFTLAQGKRERGDGQGEEGKGGGLFFLCQVEVVPRARKKAVAPWAGGREGALPTSIVEVNARGHPPPSLRGPPPSGRSRLDLPRCPRVQARGQPERWGPS